MKKTYIVLLIGIILFSCKTTKNTGKNNVLNSNDVLLASTVYQQQAAEYRAICHQNYSWAKERLNDYLKFAVLSKKFAIITDIDETILDNSPYEAKCILENISYPEQWNEWCLLADAKPVPGALEFFNYAEKKGVEVFYVTNRKEKYKDATAKNLLKLGFPFVDDDHLFFRTESNEKETRRQQIFKNYNVVLLLGDNLNDFHVNFETSESRLREADRMKDEFGKKFIVFPNAMYGEWSRDLKKSKQRLQGF